MNDQAASLRVIRGGSGATTVPRAPIQRERAIAITGGKGGVGKSSITANLAVAYAATGAKTLVVDADLGMADLNLLLGVAPDLSLLDALQGTPIADVLVQAHGITLLPALNGSSGLANLGPAARARALALIESLATKFDTLILDIAAGIGAVQTSFAGAASDTIVVVTPEPLSMADAYACLKVLRTEHGVERAYLLPNRVTSSAQADQITSSLSALVDRFLDLEVIALPAIPLDPWLVESSRDGIPVVLARPDAPSSRAIRQVARTLDSLVAPDRQQSAGRRFWHRMFETGESASAAADGSAPTTTEAGDPKL